VAAAGSCAAVGVAVAGSCAAVGVVVMVAILEADSCVVDNSVAVAVASVSAAAADHGV